MRLYYPRSFPALLGAGLTLIALPLVFSLVNNAVSIDQLANRSQNAVYQAAQATQSSRRLAELITALERTARQIVILADRSLFDAYLANRQRFEQTVAEFESLPLDAEQRRALEEIVREEKQIFAVLSDETAKESKLTEAVTRFPGLADRAQIISAHSAALIDREVEAMRATADRAQRMMLWQLLAAIPVVIFLVVGFTILITRPIQQIDAAIRRLGGGAFNVPVVVNGPQDLEYLGERLEWLRQKLLDLEQQKNRFLRQMSHELKTPLTAVREGAELLSEEVVGKLSPQQREVAEILRHNSMELQRQIEDLLNYGASQFHKVTLDLQAGERAAGYQPGGWRSAPRAEIAEPQAGCVHPGSVGHGGFRHAEGGARQSPVERDQVFAAGRNHTHTCGAQRHAGGPRRHRRRTRYPAG